MLDRVTLMQFFSYSECSGGLISELSKQKQKVEFLEVVGYFALTFVMIFLVFCLFYFFLVFYWVGVLGVVGVMKFKQYIIVHLLI